MNQMLKDLQNANLKDSYDMHWATITAYAKVGDFRSCPNCGDKMILGDDNWLNWFCNNCSRMEYLCVEEWDNDKQTHIKVVPYWFIDCIGNDEKITKGRYWD